VLCGGVCGVFIFLTDMIRGRWLLCFVRGFSTFLPQKQKRTKVTRRQSKNKTTTRSNHSSYTATIVGCRLSVVGVIGI
jgi:hypothetical protein